MYITINGQLGSGKSEICKFFKDEHGFDVFSTGRIQREKALLEGISTLEMNEKSGKDYSLDYLIDNATVKFAKEHQGEDVIFDSRLAWHFVEESFKIHLLVSPGEAGRRVFHNRKTEEEKYKSREDATNQLVQRRSLEAERYLKVYNVVMNDYNNYNLVLDTTSLSIKEVCEILYNEACEYKKGNYKNKILASPKNIYPAKKVSDEYKESDSDIVDIICFNDVMYAIDGNEKLKAANAQGKKIIEVNLIEGNKENISITLNDLYEWEKENEFNYAYYPISE
ncbi:MAG: AAA family ATPase [Eubacterium sp.]|nr:AAA family ATPase [Eubacterium sp.]MBR6392417.1 AAA family ATPase [Eubacterium sp.]